jgi:hypothetical protein
LPLRDTVEDNIVAVWETVHGFKKSNILADTNINYRARDANLCKQYD